MPVPFDGDPGTPYRPSNGHEGALFRAQFCNRCQHYDGLKCDENLIVSAMLFDRDDDEYPDEWHFDEDGRPCCTAFERDPEAAKKAA